jgi:hypothetical protein
MKKHIALGLVASTLFLAGCCTTHHTASWEYKKIGSSEVAQLNELGAQGWKVVGFARDMTGQTSNEIYILERKKQ